MNTTRCAPTPSAHGHAPEGGGARTDSGARAAERPLVFSCEGEALVGVLHEPCGSGSAASQASGSVGVVVVVGGPQVRAGSHRQFVHLARALAACGYAVLRFDVRGMGDSSGAQRGFEDITPDIGAAIAALMAAQPHLHGVVLWGLCDGASAALLYLHNLSGDTRVLGLCLLNPWVRTDVSLARTRVKHYYLQRVLQPSFWLKLMRGGVGLKAARGLRGHLSAASAGAPAGATPAYPARMAAAWRGFAHPVLLVLSGRDYTAREFETYTASATEWRGLLSHPQVTLRPMATADHTFSDPSSRLALEAAVLHWLGRLDTQVALTSSRPGHASTPAASTTAPVVT